jgi:hypothetical protein
MVQGKVSCRKVYPNLLHQLPWDIYTGHKNKYSMDFIINYDKQRLESSLNECEEHFSSRNTWRRGVYEHSIIP